MKRLIYIIAASFMALATLSACDDILNKGPLDTFADENFWTSEGNVQSYANTFFNQFAGYGNGSSYGDFYFPTLNDNQIGSGFSDWNYSNYLTTNSDWNSGYSEIRRSNIMIDKVAGMSVLTDAQKAHWTGVARMMRALQYYWLVRNFGDVPLVKATATTTDNEALYGPRVDRDQVMDFALEDINFAASNIYDVTNKTGWSRDLANAIKAEICLYEGTYCKYRVAADGEKAPDATRAASYLSAAKAACQAIMGKSYSLNTSYQGNYNSLDLAKNPEMILYKHYVQSTFGHSLVDYTTSSTQQSGMSKDAFDSYLFTDGLPKASTSKDKNDAASTFITQGKISVLDLTPILAVRDPRLAVCIDPAVLYDDNHSYIRFFDKKRADAVPMTSSSGYGVSKFDTNDLPVLFRVVGGTNFTDAPLYWLSVVYLEYAEACAELGSCTQADLDASINKLRARVGMPSMTVSPAADPANDMKVSNLIWEIRRERRVELMYDNNFRFWDLNRWHQLDKLDSTTNPDIFLGANVSHDTNLASSTKVTNGYLSPMGTTKRVYDKKYYFYPIPKSQMILNPALTQNPGWDQ